MINPTTSTTALPTTTIAPSPLAAATPARVSRQAAPTSEDRSAVAPTDLAREAKAVDIEAMTLPVEGQQFAANFGTASTGATLRRR